MTGDEIMSAPMVERSADVVHVLQPERGRRGGRADVHRAAAAGVDRVEIKALEFRTRRFGTFEVFSPWLAPEITDGATVHAARAAFEAAGIGPDEIDVAQLQDTEAGAELMHLAECGFCAHGDQDRS